MRRLAAAVGLLLVAVVAATPTGAAKSRSQLADPYRGLGAWVSLYGTEWRNPVAAVQALAARGVRTLYVETGRSTSAAAIERPTQTALFLESAHARGMAVVAWYYPTFVRWGMDADRTIATARWRSPDGHRFDGVAPDIEDPAVRNPTERSKRLVAYTNRIMSAVPGYPWGAITYPPIGLDLNPRAWPGFPWQFVARRYVAILPMAYWRNRTRTAAGAAWYAAGNLAALRVLTRRSDLTVHLIGSARTTGAEAGAFATSALDFGAEGVSLYPANRVSAAEWTALTTSFPSG